MSETAKKSPLAMVKTFPGNKKSELHSLFLPEDPEFPGRVIGEILHAVDAEEVVRRWNAYDILVAELEKFADEKNWKYGFEFLPIRVGLNNAAQWAQEVLAKVKGTPVTGENLADK